MDGRKGESTAASRAQDVETQTNFDINGTSEPTPSQSIERASQQYRSQPTWNGRYPYQPSNYHDGYYAYDGGYPPPPPPGPYYQGRPAHWHQPPGGMSYPPAPPPPGHAAGYRRGEYPPGNYYNGNQSEAPGRRATTDIVRPKAEWPRGYQSFAKPTVPSEFLAMHASQRGTPSEYPAPPSTATSLRSTVIDLPSPRTSARMTRKRARSNTPASSVESIDLNLLIRNSPDSLLGGLIGTRLSSAGSFGHLSPIGFCTSPACRRTPVGNRPPSFITPPPIPPLQSPTIAQTRDLYPTSTTEADPAVDQERMSCTDSPSPPEDHHREVEVQPKKEEFNETCKLDSTTSPGASEHPQTGSDVGGDEMPGEAEGVDLTCHWKDCTIVFDSQDSLVKHVNGDHIKKEKRDFTCYWQDCSREQRPFKAQYMLVVHMRRHTGEKPHKCYHEGCTKAYSRLENLKTHLRSHTGERPYVCEVEGCTKAFSNASDRAKHQNRTHSSVKPYVCKVPGCPKRYTDPSSLRKHTKTVHGEQGIKRLKEDSGRDKQSSFKNSSGPSTDSAPPSNQSKTTVNTNSFAHSPSSDIKSPASTMGGSGGSYCGIVANSCDGEVVSSSVDSPHSNIHTNEERSPGPAQSGVSLRSPRSPPYINQLPNILEGDVEGAGDIGAVTTVQQIQPVAMAHSKSITLPKIPEAPAVKKDVVSWVNDVHRRMSQTSSRRSSEASHLSADLAGDASRRSSESGWASNNESRRSSQASPFPSSKIVIESINQPESLAARNGKLELQCNLGLEESLRRASNTSTTSSQQSVPFNRLSRNSSGYGSQSNLALIRSTGFQPPYSFGREIPQYRLHHKHNNTFRRMSDTVICEADSSVMTSQDNKEEFRRRSEPTRNINWTAHRQDFLSPLSPRAIPNKTEFSETELITDDFDPSEFDAYLNPEQQDPALLMSPSGRQTHPLRHFPYPPDSYPEPVHMQTIHHRPYPPQYPPNMPRQHPQEHHEMQRRVNYMRQQQQYQQQQQRLQALPQGQMVTQYAERYPPYQAVYVPDRRHPVMVGAGEYEDAMVNSMGALSTEASAAPEDLGLGNGNMVVNDMNTLLNSLAEEDKYLEMRQNASGINGSTMSSIF